MVVRHELVKCSTQVLFAKRHDPTKHSSLTDRTKRSAYALQFGARSGVRTTKKSPFCPTLESDRLATRLTGSSS